MSKKSKNSLRIGTDRDFNVVGWREIVALPKLKIPRIKAKVDTGAKSSALHAFNIEELTHNGKSIVRFQVHPLQKDDRTTITTKAKLLEYREVTNSGGQAELRPVITTEVTIGQQTWTIDLTLTDRYQMGFRMLLGRQAIRNKFLVDSGKSFLQGEPKDKNN